MKKLIIIWRSTQTYTWNIEMFPTHLLAYKHISVLSVPGAAPGDEETSGHWQYVLVLMDFQFPQGKMYSTLLRDK